MQIIPGFYNLSQIRHLALTKDHSDNYMFLVTLRDNQLPAILPEVDLTHWLWIDQNSVATVWFKELATLHGFAFIREFEKMYLIQEPAYIVPHLFEEFSILNLEQFEQVMHSDEFLPATDRLRKEPLCMLIHPDLLSVVEVVQHAVLNYMSEVRLKKPLFIQCAGGDSAKVFVVIIDQKCSVFKVNVSTVARHTYDLTTYVNGLTPLFMRATRGGPYRSPNTQEAQANMLPRPISLDGTKIRNASFSGTYTPKSRLAGELVDMGVITEVNVESSSIDPGTQLYWPDLSGGRVSEVRREMGRNLGPRELPNGFHPSDKDLHGPDGELLARAIPGSGFHSQIDPVAFKRPINSPYGDLYKTTPSATVKTDGPEPEPVEIPWDVLIKVFRMQLLASLQEKHQMTCDQAIAYLHEYQIREDDDGLLRPLMQAAKPLQNLW